MNYTLQSWESSAAAVEVRKGRLPESVSPPYCENFHLCFFFCDSYTTYPDTNTCRRAGGGWAGWGNKARVVGGGGKEQTARENWRKIILGA